ncbi:MAG TPA: NFACT RNA binding domain-containing protein [Chryseolinea sp.]|nr:NFACT RNA binding domain-containing protein [Chryseolinea sp.]
MHNNYYFLRQLTPALEDAIRSSVVSECFSQNKDELVIRFERKDSPFFIKASLSPSFSCLSFPDNFQRARKNSVDLFEKLIGQRVEGIRQYENERSFTVNFSNNFSLLFKLHGNRSNLILFHNDIVDEIFKNKILDDGSLSLNNLDKVIDWSYENFLRYHNRPESIYFTFGKIVWNYLKEKGYLTLTTEEQWQAIQTVHKQLTNPSYSIREANGKIFLSLLDFGRLIKKIDEPLQAIHEFYVFYTQQDSFSREKASVISQLKSNLRATENYVDKVRGKLRELEDDNNFKMWADLLMANLHTILPGAEQVTLPDFYHDSRPTLIKLKRELSPQKNAAIFYKKAKNQHIEISHLQKILANKVREHTNFIDQLKEIEAAEDLRSLRKITGKLEIAPAKEKQSESLPYREMEFNGFKIWIGKNAQSNDTLTLKYSHKDDLWLHAKDVSGSHVLVKHQSGKNFPRDVIERAAQLAAYYSKRKNETLCPVSVTPKKYVRKRKGDPAGLVVVEREEVLMVVPSLNGNI